MKIPKIDGFQAAVGAMITMMAIMVITSLAYGPTVVYEGPAWDEFKNLRSCEIVDIGARGSKYKCDNGKFYMVEVRRVPR